MKKNKLLYLSGATFKNPTAQLVHVMKMSSGLSQYYDVDLFVFDKNNSINLSEFALKRQPNILSFKQKKISVSLQLLYVLFFQLIKTHYKAIITRSVMVAFFCSVLRINFVYETHDAFRGYLKNIFEPHIFKSKTLIQFVVISKSLAEDYKILFECNPLVCHDAADIYDRSIPIRKTVKNIFYVGSLYAGRGIEIIQQLSTKYNDINFHIYGGDKQYSNLNMHYHGYVSQSEIKKKIFQADLLLMPYQEKLETAGGGIDTSRWMSPMKMFEYMSFGLPIISSDIPVIKEVLNSDNAMFASPSDIVSWDGALKSLCDDFDLRAYLAYNAKKDQLNYYTWEQRAEKFYEFIENS